MFPAGEIPLNGEIPGLTEIADISKDLVELSRNILPEGAGYVFLGITGGTMQVIYSFSDAERKNLQKEIYCKRLFFVSMDNGAGILFLEGVNFNEFPPHVKNILIPAVREFMAARGYISIS